MPQLSIVEVEASCRELVPTARRGLPLCTSYREGVFSVTGLPVYGVLGNSVRVTLSASAESSYAISSYIQASPPVRGVAPETH
jgi:hypothetical protein